MSTKTEYGIPDIVLPLANGGTINPGDFNGHELVVLFCPQDRATAARELTDFNGYADQFAYNDAWIIAVSDDTEIMPAGRISVAADPELRAWRAFNEGQDPRELPPRQDGAVFLFGRGGSITRIWRGTGHANEVVKELGLRM